jgi:tetratricopeptide (TPR) repeat protein
MYPRYHFGWSELYALTDGASRYILTPRDELYDLQADPGETKNLAGDRRLVRDGMRASLMPFVQPAANSRPRDISQDDLEKFQALGYIGMSVQPASGEALPDPKDKIGIFTDYRAAIEAGRTGHLDQAIEAYRHILADNPQMLDAWDRLATVLQRANRGDEAILVLRRIVSLAPDNASAHLRLGRALTRRHKFDDAVAEARSALAREPAEANELLARISFERGAVDEAVPFAEAALKVDAGLPLPYYVQGLVKYQRGQYDAALPFFEKAAAALQARPGLALPGVYLHLGDCQFRANRRDEAGKSLAMELKLYPDNLEARTRLGAYYLATNQRTAFVQLFTELVRNAPSPDNYRVAERVLTQAGETEAARALPELKRARK